MRIAKGDHDAFEILVNRHQISVLNLIYRFIGDRTQAKDLAQEVFLRVWQTAKSYESRAKFTTWIYRIATNLCLNELKSPAAGDGFTLRPDEDNKGGSGEDLLPDGYRLERIYSWQMNAAIKSPRPFRACLPTSVWRSY